MFSSRTTSSPVKTNIEEANKHLQMLYLKVSELESSLKVNKRFD